MAYVLELPQERFLLCGKMSQPAFVGNAFNEGGVNQEVQVGGPAIALVDSRGNLIKQKIFPVEDLRLAAPVYVTDIGGAGRLTHAFPTSDGGYFAVGEFRNIGIGVASRFYPPEPGNVASFLLYMDQDFNLRDFIMLSADPSMPFDFINHVATDIKPKPGGGYLMLIGSNLRVPDSAMIGFSFMELDDNGRILSNHELYNNTFRFAQTFDYMNNGNLVVIGQNNFDSIHLFEVGYPNFNMVGIHSVEKDGIGGIAGWNNNDLFVMTRPEGGYTCAFPRPSIRATLYVQLNDQFEVTLLKNYEPNLENQYPRSATLASNGDLLVLNDDLTAGENVHSFLYRIDKGGNTIFRQGYNGPGRYVSTASDNDILMLTDLPFNGASVLKSNLFKMKSNGTF